MPDYPTSAKEVGHNHEVEPRVLGERLRAYLQFEAEQRERAALSSSMPERKLARGLANLWSKQISDVRRELRRRERIGTLNPA